MKSRYGRMFQASMAGACAVVLSLPACAQDAKVLFHVAAGPAAVSIPEFARQANITVLANGEHLAGKTTRTLDGMYTQSQALDYLLAGSDLEASVNANGSVLIQRKRQRIDQPPKAGTPRSDPDRELPQVLVAGTRASQQTSIGLKKHADTALDAIVAEDVGAFPDRNVAEAISRLAGVTLDRGEYGEGTTINVRGNPASQTRVEIDGLGVQAGGGTDLNNGGSGRGVELRELSADLIKSIEVVKGATVDMTEGSLGGAVIIQTRNGLDFKQRYVALRVAAQQNSINEKWTPNLNFVFADRLLDKRLGVVVNLSRTAARNENHTVFISPLAAGMSRIIDFDQSPQKTFSFNPSTVSTTDPAATAPMERWGKTGGGTFDSLSPLEIVTRSANAASKADCYAAFPLYASADVAAIASSANRAAALSQRANELRSCLNQWNDYTPQNLRYQMRRQYDQRLNGALRLDFKVNKQLSVFAKVDRNTRKIEDEQLFFSLGGIAVNPDGSYADMGSTPNIVRSPAATGFYFYPTPSNLGASGSTWRGLTNGSVVNIVPTSVQVDANHHVTQYTIGNAFLNNDQLFDQIATSSSYMQVGGSWRSGGFRADLLLGRAKAHETRMQWRTSLSFPYGPATVRVGEDGLWTYESPPGVSYDQGNMANYARLFEQSSPGSPLVSAATPLTLANPRLMKRDEDTAKLDMSYALGAMIPFLGRLKFGASRRAYEVSSWTGAGYTAQASGASSAEVVVPRAAINSSFQACENTPASLAPGGAPCRYGTSYSGNPATAFNSSIVMSQADYRNVVAQVLNKDTITYFNSLPDRPAGLPSGWTEIDVRKVMALTGAQHFNLDCVQFCKGSDGKLYEQPRTGVAERYSAGYLSTDFAFDRIPLTSLTLPFGWELGGNFGWRIVRTDVAATGLMTFQTISKTAAYDPLNPNAAGGTATTALARNTAIRNATTDVMPILNLAWWPMPERLLVRYNKSKAIARPPVEYLYSNGVTCTFDERRLAPGSAADMSCDDTLGNPALRAATSHNYNLALEWYPNKDTVVSVTRFRQEGIIGAPIRVAVNNGRPFALSGTRDPATGRDLSDVAYTYATYVNGPASERDGYELSSKTAFTFLPSVLRYTGLDMNYTRATSVNQQGQVRDLITGDVMAPANELAYTWNASLWYDDGKLRARLAIQSAAAYFRGLTTASNSYPANGVSGDPVLSFNPATPTFRDARRFLDAKVSYKFDNGIELFVEGRNLGRTPVTNSQGAYVPFAGGTPNLLDYSYSGAQYMLGITYRH